MKPLAIAFLLVAGCQSAPTAPSSADSPASLAAAETAFAAQAAREGVRTAFLAWLAPGATVYRNGPVDGPATVFAEPDPPIVLEWRPVFVETAASDDMGLSTGPWRITRRGDASAPPKYGQFVSVWKRDGKGAWRVHVDLGISHPEPVLAQAALAASQTAPVTRPSRGSLEEAEAGFARHARESGTASAFAAWASESLRLYRQGHAPALGRHAAIASGLLAQAREEWSRQHSETSSAGDLGFAMGRFAAPGGSLAGHYLRVWRREAGGWRIALDVTEDLSPR
jgi:ketosteroid isomerase-like protein